MFLQLLREAVAFEEVVAAILANDPHLTVRTENEKSVIEFRVIYRADRAWRPRLGAIAHALRNAERRENLGRLSLWVRRRRDPFPGVRQACVPDMPEEILDEGLARLRAKPPPNAKDQEFRMNLRPCSHS